MTRKMSEYWKQEFNKVIEHLTRAKKYGQIAYSYPILCRKNGKTRLSQVTGFKYIYALLKPNLYSNYDNSTYPLQVQYDYIKNHIDYTSQMDLPQLDCDYNLTTFDNYYGNIAYTKWYRNLNLVSNGDARFGYFTTYRNERKKSVYIDYNPPLQISSKHYYKKAHHKCLNKIYEKRKKEHYANLLLELYCAFRLKKRMRMSEQNIRTIMSYLVP